MALSSDKRKELLALDLPSSVAVRKQIQDYLARTGLTAADFARRIGYSPVSMGKFMNGTYHHVASNDGPLRAASLEFIRNHPVGAPTEVKGKLYETEAVRLIRHYFNEALEGHFAACLAGGPGMGKTTVLQHLISDLNRTELSKNGHGKRAYYIYCAAKVTPNQLLKDIAIATGSLAVGDNRRIIRNLRFDFMTRRVNLIFDEAQHLDAGCFETIKELYDLPPHFGMIFSGTHQLGRFLEVHKFDLEQVNRRMKAMCQLPGLSEAEATEIAKRELPELGPRKIAKLIELSWTEASARQGIQKYISAGRLFDTIKAWRKDEAKGATA